LQEIMETMNRSVQSMNLEKVLSELKFLKANTNPEMLAASQILPITQKPESITAGINLNTPTPVSDTGEAQEPEVYGFVPKKKKKGDDEDEPHLMRPSDLFK
ncbi:MAG: hypothetical protein KGD73_12730, partial [Candidatus Lokiarchaeota archaeon]|nr:hypothetical protein [Candidatus Lokiarchaeota archaeon]